MTAVTDALFWLGHSSFRLVAGYTVYFDPWEVEGPPADLILISHDHDGHCDPETVKRLSGPKTKIFCERRSAAKLRAAGVKAQIMVLEPFDEVEIYYINIKTVPAYNLNNDRHPKENGYLGFVVTVGNFTVYHAGDTDFIPEMKDIEAGAALLPVSGGAVMAAEEAAEAARAINPETAIAMHIGKRHDDAGAACVLAEALKGQVPVEIKPLEK